MESLMNILVHHMIEEKDQKIDIVRQLASSSGFDPIISGAGQDDFLEEGLNRINQNTNGNQNINSRIEREALPESESNRNGTGGSTSSYSSNEALDNVYFGGHTSISLFSSIGMRWISKYISDTSLLFPLKNLISNVSKLQHRFLKIWVDPIDKSGLVSLPPREVINLLLESMSLITVLNSLFVDDARRLANLYCDYREGKIPEPKFTYGELLLLNGVLLVSCSSMTEKAWMKISPQKMVTSKELKDYEKYLLDNTLFYFHRVVLLSDGLTGLGGILLLVYYTDSISLLQSGHLMCSIAVRQAQSMGLHRRETYRHLTPFDKARKLSLWWWCYSLDQTLSLKTGKPPTINDIDVNAPPLFDVPGYCKVSRSINDDDSLYISTKKKLFTKIMKEPKGVGKVYFAINVDLSTLIARMHRDLFTAHSLIKKTPAHVIRISTSLLQDLENWRCCFPNELNSTKPMNFSEVTTDEPREFFKRCIVAVLDLKYQYLKMIVSMASVKLASGFNKRYFSSVGIESARELLHSAHIFDGNVIHLAGFILHYPFSAFLTVSAFYIQSPKAPKAKEDLKLLIAVSRSFNVFAPTLKANEKWMIVDAIMRCVLLIVYTTVTEANKDDDEFEQGLEVGDLLDEVKELAKKAKNNELPNNQVSSTFMKVIDSCTKKVNERNNRIYNSTGSMSSPNATTTPTGTVTNATAAGNINDNNNNQTGLSSVHLDSRIFPFASMAVPPFVKMTPVNTLGYNETPNTGSNLSSPAVYNNNSNMSMDTTTNNIKESSESMHTVPLPIAMDPAAASPHLMQISSDRNNNKPTTNTNTNTNTNANPVQNQRSGTGTRSGSGGGNAYLDYTNLLGFFGNDDSSIMGGNGQFGTTSYANGTGGGNTGVGGSGSHGGGSGGNGNEDGDRVGGRGRGRGSIGSNSGYPTDVFNGDAGAEESLFHAVLSIPPTYQLDFNGFGSGPW
ncbi:unnamed protein product [Ambrosiozyma monospora]|uniref:Unnamed protein product n=1 Tax=Ambrosiozyma monospora TaxID=43982 RepID=A0A9W6YZ54_AMBMO|nr:unnamed protein product [Ambrosiozyma monospora]